jgi:hypothetical protein
MPSMPQRLCEEADRSGARRRNAAEQVQSQLLAERFTQHQTDVPRKQTSGVAEHARRLKEWKSRLTSSGMR